MTLITLKDDSITWILPRYEERYTYDEDSCIPIEYIESIFSVSVDFERSSDFRFERRSSLIDESVVSNAIMILLNKADKFKDLTAEEFKAQLDYFLNHITR